MVWQLMDGSILKEKKLRGERINSRKRPRKMSKNKISFLTPKISKIQTKNEKKKRIFSEMAS